MTSQASLLAARRFAPMFACTCTGAFNDNFFKNALIILITYRLTSKSGLSAETLISLASAMFILPFVLLSGIAGTLADHVPQHRMVQWLKITELLLCALAIPALVNGHVWALMSILVLLGVQAAFMGPVKYAILPSLLWPNELIAGNGLTEAGTFIAILLGTICGGLLILHPHGALMVGLGMFGVALFGLWASRRILPTPTPTPLMLSQLRPLRSTMAMLRLALSSRRIFLAILGISWFWGVGTMYMTQLPIFTKQVLGGNAQLVTFFFVLFSVGIGAGSLLCNKLVGGVLNLRYVPISMLGLMVFGLDMWWVGHTYPPPTGALIGVAEFLSVVAHWRIALDLLALALCGGIFIVPLYTLLQTEGEASERARVIASNNIMNALIIAIISGAIALAYIAGAVVLDIFLIISLLCLPAAWFLKKQLA